MMGRKCNCAKGERFGQRPINWPTTDDYKSINVTLHELKARDLVDYNIMEQDFERVATLIDNAAVANGKVLLHCQGGTNRYTQIQIAMNTKTKKWKQHTKSKFQMLQLYCIIKHNQYINFIFISFHLNNFVF